jgi:hypothetical protein
MANVRATKNGNWSDPTVWNTGALPTTADDVFTNTFTVNVDTSFEVLSLRNTSGTSITAGGTFNFNSGDVSGSCTSATGIVPGVTNLFTITANTGTVTINAPLTTITAISSGNTQVINHTGACDFSITCNTLIGGSNSGNGVCILKSSIRTITIIANLIAGVSGASGCTALTSTGGNTIIIGNLSGGTLGISPAVSQNSGILTVTGSISGGHLTTQPGVLFSGTQLNISGSVIGILGTGISLSSAANINISGSILAGASAAAITSTGAHTFIWNQPIEASAGSPAIVSTSLSATNIFTGPFYNNGATMAVQAARMFLSTGSTSWQFTSDAVGVSQSLSTADQIPTYPSSSDVRLGTSYGSGSLTGTLAMPQAS